MTKPSDDAAAGLQLPSFGIAHGIGYGGGEWDVQPGASMSGSKSTDSTDRGSMYLPEGELATVEVAALTPDPALPPRIITDESVSQAALQISDNGMLQRMLVRRGEGSDTYFVFVGIRRYRALVELGVESVTVEVHDVSEVEARWLAASEQETREDRSQIERAWLVYRLTTGPDGEKDDEAAERCTVIFSQSGEEPLTDRRIQQMRRVASTFDEATVIERGIPLMALSKFSGNKLSDLCGEQDPWRALEQAIASGGYRRQREATVGFRVRRNAKGGATWRLPPGPPESWSETDLDAFREHVDQILGAPEREGAYEDDEGGSQPSQAGLDYAELEAERNGLLRRVAYLATELAQARSIIASLHASRAVAAHRGADRHETEGGAFRWTSPWSWRRWFGAFRSSAPADRD